MDLLGLLTGNQGKSYDRVFVDADQATGLADAATLLQMLEDREGFVVGKLAVVQGCTLRAYPDNPILRRIMKAKAI